jgi:hypothetical protein
MSKLTKRTYNLTDADLKNLKLIETVGGTRSAAEALSGAIWLTAHLQNLAEKEGAVIQLRRGDGSIVEIASPLLKAKI